MRTKYARTWVDVVTAGSIGMTVVTLIIGGMAGFAWIMGHYANVLLDVAMIGAVLGPAWLIGRGMYKLGRWAYNYKTPLERELDEFEAGQ